MTLDQLSTTFKVFGKIVFLSQQAAPAATALKRAHVALVDQQAGMDDPDAEFDIDAEVVRALGAAVRDATTRLAGLPGKAQRAAQTYLSKFLAVDLGLAAGATVAQVGTALVAAMTAAGASVAPAAGNPNGLATYFATQLGITLPTNATPTIPDAWISDTVV